MSSLQLFCAANASKKFGSSSRRGELKGLPQKVHKVRVLRSENPFEVKVFNMCATFVSNTTTQSMFIGVTAEGFKSVSEILS